MTNDFKLQHVNVLKTAPFPRSMSLVGMDLAKIIEVGVVEKGPIYFYYFQCFGV